MQLSDLHPKITETGFLVFDCPKCQSDSNAHRIRVPLYPAVDRGGRSWSHTGNLEAITLNPSVDAGCWHGNITAGAIVGGI